MGNISRRAADELKRTVQIVKGLAPKGAGFADPGRPIRLAVTTDTHARGDTQVVKLLWGTPGEEEEGTADHDSVEAFNRGDDLNAGAVVHIARVGPVWEILNRSSTSTSGGGCGACTTPPDSITVDLGGDLMASSDYSFAPFCADWVIFRFVHDTGGTWNGIADTEEVECTPGSPVAFTATLVASGSKYLPGEVTATVSDGASDWTFTNEVAWQPDQPFGLLFKTGPLPCPCAPFRPEVCLVPIPPVVEP